MMLKDSSEAMRGACETISAEDHPIAVIIRLVSAKLPSAPRAIVCATTYRRAQMAQTHRGGEDTPACDLLSRAGVVDQKFAPLSPRVHANKFLIESDTGGVHRHR